MPIVDIFNSQAFSEGQLHFEFFTHSTDEHVELQDFETYRRIFGVTKENNQDTLALIFITFQGHWYLGLSRMER